MSEIRRRGFLARVGAGCAGVAAFLYPGIARPGRASAAGLSDAGSTSELPPDPSYAGGTVSSVAADEYVLTSAAGARSVRIPPGSLVWKEFDGPPHLIEIGDWLDVKGAPQEDGSLLATSGMIFVNIARLDGELLSTSPSHMTVYAYGRRMEVELSPRLEAIHAEDQTPYAGGVLAIPKGRMIGAVGLRLPNGGFRATRIWT